MRIMPAANVPTGLSMTLTLGGGPTVSRLGFGALRVAGPGAWGPPHDEAQAVALLRLTPHAFILPMIERHMRDPHGRT